MNDNMILQTFTGVIVNAGKSMVIGNGLEVNFFHYAYTGGGGSLAGTALPRGKWASSGRT